MKTKVNLFIASFFLINICTAQTLSSKDCVQVLPGSTPTTNKTTSNSIELASTNTPNFNKIKGSPYLSNTFERSTIYTNNTLLGEYYSRYNAYTKEIEIKNDFGSSIIPNVVGTKIVFNSKEIHYLPFIDADGNQQVEYLIVKNQGKSYRLYQRLKVRFKEKQEAQNSSEIPVEAKFSQFSEYYLMELTTNTVKYISTKKSKFLKLFKESDKKLVGSLIKKKSLNLKKEEALLTIFDFADTLDTYYVTSDK